VKQDEQILLLVALLGLGAWLWFFRSGRTVAQSAGAAIATGISTGVETVRKLARGERNNNPGNIRISASTWQGKIPVASNTDGSFEQFDTVQNGIRALGKLLLNYSSKYGLRTVRGLIKRYAPPIENVTDSYINAVAAAMGVSPDEPLELRASETLFQLSKAIIKHENGRVAYADEIIQEGVNRALV